ncbi:MAG: SprT family zinc-dependent metalloprotease, partial [Ignavibacteriaceae bacterium]
IKNRGDLEVILPRGFQITDAEKFLQKKSNWIRKHTKERKEFRNKFYLLGYEIKVTQKYDLFVKRHKISFTNNHLDITSPAKSAEHSVMIYEAWLKKLAKKTLTERVRKIASELNFKVGKIAIRGQKTRWGSCSTNGNLSFNYSLLRFRKEIIDYVIIHELCHLKEMNHSERFWKLVEGYYPDYKNLRKELKDHPL